MSIEFFLLFNIFLASNKINFVARYLSNKLQIFFRYALHKYQVSKLISLIVTKALSTEKLSYSLHL